MHPRLQDILPKSLSLLRPFRAFRVFRLFKRVPSLNKIMVSLGKAIPGVSNAFLIMVIIMCIYAILAVEFFSQFGKEGVYTTQQDHANRDVDAEWATVCDERGEHCYTYENATVTSITARGFTWGEEYYGTFMRALYTLFQARRRPAPHPAPRRRHDATPASSHAPPPYPPSGATTWRPPHTRTHRLVARR